MPASSDALCFVDSNVWLYTFLEDQDEFKRKIAADIVEGDGIAVSPQVINEVCVNLLRRTRVSEETIYALIESFYSTRLVCESSRSVLLRASDLRGQFSFSYWDSLIVASALASGAKTLYSEDMQNGLAIGNLTISNPFAATKLAD